MKKLNSTANGKRLHAVLRLIEDIVCNPALANYTPSGPGSLATGQYGAAGRSGPHIHADVAGHREHRHTVHPTFAEFSLPLRQVFWV